MFGGSSGEGDLLGDKGLGPCAVTLQLKRPCRQGHDEDSCPYLFTLPPLTVHLPKQLSELEKIVKDLQKLKDNVDQLRQMCADCTVSQTERECGTQREREHVKLNEGTDRHEDKRKWVNERSPERREDFRQEFGTDGIKVEKTMEEDGVFDSEKRKIFEKRGRKKWEAARESNKGVIKENEKAEMLIEVALKGGKTQIKGANANDKLGQAKMPTAGGNGKIVDMTGERVVLKNNEKDRKGNLKGDHEDKLESGKERQLTSDNKNKEKTEESDRHFDETRDTDKNNQTEVNRGSDGIKTSEDHDEHTNKEQEQRWEDKKKIETGIKVEPSNERPKQTESIGRTEKEKAIKKGEGEEADGEMGTEIKPEGEKMVPTVQRDSDEELTSNRAIEWTDFASTSQSTISVAPRHDSIDSNKATTLTQFLPSPPPPLSSTHLITDVKQPLTIAAPGLPTQSTHIDVAHISEHPQPYAEAGFRPTSRKTTTATLSTMGVPGQQITRSTKSFTSTTSPRSGAGFLGQVSSTVATTTTSTPSRNFHTTTSTGVADRSHLTAKRNITSHTKTGVKPRPGQEAKPLEKHKPGIKPEAGQKQKKTKNDHKSDSAPLSVKKTKQDQKFKTPPPKPTAHPNPKTGKDPQRDQSPKPDQGMVKNYTVPNYDQDQKIVQEPNSHQKSTPPVQRRKSHQTPVMVKATGFDKDPSSERLNSNPGKKLKRPLKTNKPDSKQKPEKKLNSKEKAKPDLTSLTNQHLTTIEEPDSEQAETTKLTPKPNQEPKTDLIENSDGNLSPEPNSNQDTTPTQKVSLDRINIPSNQKPKPGQKTPIINQNRPKFYQQRPELGTDKKTKPNLKPKPGQTLQTPQPGQMPNLLPKSVPDEIPKAESNQPSNPRPPVAHGLTLKPGTTSVRRTKPAVQLKSSPKTKTDLDPHIIGRNSDGIQNSQTDMPPTSGPVKQTAGATHSLEATEFSPSTKKTITLGPTTSNSLESGRFPLLHALPKGFTMSPNSRITSDLQPQTAGQPTPIPMTTRPNKIMHGILPSVIPSTSPGSTRLKPASNTDSSLQTKILPGVEETAPRQIPDPDQMLIPVSSPSAQTTSTLSPEFRSTTPATSGPEAPAAESSTRSSLELLVKINQVAAFPSNNRSPNRRSQDDRPKDDPEDKQGGNHKLPTWISSKATAVRRDCSDHLLRGGTTRSGVYLVTPEIRSRSFSVSCDMEQAGGGWTLLQRRQDGSVSFNRTWAEYRSGFGKLDGGEFWLGNNMIHLLTRDQDTVLRVELEDFDGVKEYAEYEHFKVASERLLYRLTVGGYSGTAGDALRFSETYDHNNRPFTTPDRDNDRYPSGNCGAYYSSGWWFDACMAANLNGRYYLGKYTGQRGPVGLLRCWSLTVTPRCPLHTSRSFSVTAPAKSPTPEEPKRPLKQWALAVSPFSAVRARLACSISIRPLDPHTFPEADRAFVTVHGADAERDVGLDHVLVHYDDQTKELLISAERLNSSVSVDLAAPIKSNLFITTQGGGNVNVKNMECDICKGHQVEVRSNGGHVTGVGTIHGNVDISTLGDGAVDVKKLQGTRMNVSTEHGPLQVKAIYAESSCISSSSGRVQLGHVHGEASVKNMSGDTVIDGSNSFLTVSSHNGGIDVYVGDGGSAQLHSEGGAVCLRVPSSLRAGVDLCGASVEISPDVVLHEAQNNTSQGQTTVTGCMNGALPVDRWVKARADKGSVRLKTQSWFESLKLGR
ncbi:hypothetical protein F2P81_007137 [Scophthalmus maximus]|uniref:Fibrinogen C-terminal domain-containing protein n=1 Tax=Scophthalmus maximus TaxID=52904 RepID=A0A6A4T8Q8_SCOMX|nr:hypothetical protein F2P81_007137 [Scophthalmus maximus]